ncbi:MAG TPA: GNAT family protein [Acidimicrobiales bacterium]
MIDGESTRLREPRDTDLGVLGVLRNDLALQRQLLARPRPNSAGRVREWVDRVSAREDAVFFVIADLADQPLGFVQVVGIDTVNGHGSLGIALVVDARGAGHGPEAIAMVGTYLREVFGLRKLVLEVAADNAAAIGAYREVGFVDVGVLAQHVRSGAGFVDVLIMERLLTP